MGLSHVDAMTQVAPDRVERFSLSGSSSIFGQQSLNFGCPIVYSALEGTGIDISRRGRHGAGPRYCDGQFARGTMQRADFAYTTNRTLAAMSPSFFNLRSRNFSIDALDKLSQTRRLGFLEIEVW